MNTKKFVGMFTAAIIPIGLMIGGGNFSYAEEETHKHSEKAEAVKDPVCSMEVDNIKKAPSEKYKDKVYYFCSKKCVKIFKKNPAPPIPVVVLL